MLLEKQNVPQSFLIYELMLNLSEDDVDIDKEMRKVPRKSVGDEIS